MKAILHQESRSGFANATVIGGLDKFLDTNWNQLSKYIKKIETPYSDRSLEDRKIWISTILGILSTEIGELNVSDRVNTSLYQKKDVFNDSSYQGIKLSDPIEKLRNFGGSKFKKLMSEKFAVTTVGDLVMHLPDHHDDFTDLRKLSDLTVGETQTSVLSVRDVKQFSMGYRRTRNQVTLFDETGVITVTFFNQPWINKNLKKGSRVLISGRVGVHRGKITFQNASYESITDNSINIHTGRFVPVYPLTDGIHQKTMRRIVALSLSSAVNQVKEYLPKYLLNRTGLMGRADSIKRYHYPRNKKDLSDARRRLAFDELFLIALVAEKRRLDWKSEIASPHITLDPGQADLANSLPFQLTESQKKAVTEILKDLSNQQAMRRMLQGDVGSGKTAVATLSMLAVSSKDYQSALMAPTEVLAEQHFSEIARLLNPDIGTHVLGDDGNIIEVQVKTIRKNVKIALLMGSLKEATKTRTKDLLSEGEIDIVVGTHALIQESVEIPNLALAVVDEQHRFGVLQRSILHDKNPRPHLLVMSATPIPRSLLLTMCGDLDITVLDELPSGRKPIETLIETPDRRENVYEFVRKQIQDGRQAFIVYPLVEDSKSIHARSAVSEFDRLTTEVFEDLNLGLIHGKMTLSEKEEVMDKFKSGELDILVATSVIEVGVDVPNASVIVIDGADRFGLAQMHQFRGRVGRSKHQSYCVLIAESPNPDAQNRMEILHRVSDGFALAEEDMNMRGTGDYLGTRQSGQEIFKVASLSDHDILSLARVEAKKMVQNDPYLESDEHTNIRNKYASQLEELSVQVN
mgnify:CR=1 FL=1